MTPARFSPIRAALNPENSTRSVGRQYQALVLLLMITLTLFAGIGSRLAHLQLLGGDRNRVMAEENRIRLISKQPDRGKILDRKGRVMAGGRLSHSIYVWSVALKDENWERTRQQLASILKTSEADIQKRLERGDRQSPLLIRIAKGLSPAQVTALKEQAATLPGVMVDSEIVRNYPYGDLAAHVLGYIGEISSGELDRRTNEAYLPGDVVGQMGAEAAFESLLRGERGGQQVEIDGTGQVLRILGKKTAQPGQDVALTLDLDLQKVAETTLGKRDGAIVALNPNTGEVLAMVSRPSFDPNLFTTQITSAQWERLQSQEFPFVNRALQGYPPASTFKVVTTVAGIESKEFSPDAVLQTYPYLDVGGIQFWDWNKAGFGPLGFVGAMAQSSNTFFGQVGMAAESKMLIQWARRFGYGEPTGIELAEEESAGLVPNQVWKQETLGEDWFVGDTINLSIGQGAMQATPLQVAKMFAGIANGGYRVRPHLLAGNLTTQTDKEALGISPETIRLVQQSLREVVTNGTGQALNLPGIPAIAGKSGTAEDPPRKSHAWFGAYAPFDKPEIVVVAFAENSGGGGGSVAAPMVKQMLEAYFKQRK